MPRTGQRLHIAEVSASNAITSASYLLKAAGAESTTWNLRGLSIAAMAFAVGIHTVAPRIGRWLQDILSAVKLFILAFIVCTGFAAFGGHLRIPRTGNLDVATSFKGTSNSGYNIGTALMDAIFSFGGYDNLNMVPFPPMSAFSLKDANLLDCGRFSQKLRTLTVHSALRYQLP